MDYHALGTSWAAVILAGFVKRRSYFLVADLQAKHAEGTVVIK